jgi:hypothetical protein
MAERIEITCDGAPDCPGLRCLDCPIVALAPPEERAELLREAEAAMIGTRHDAL